MQFVILRHELPAESGRASHWDLLLETSPEGLLETWAIEQEPQPGQTLVARQLAPHRRLYLDYEGPVSGDRGHVTRWDRGHYTAEFQRPDGWGCVLRGTRLANVRLVAERSPPPAETFLLTLIDLAASASPGPT